MNNSIIYFICQCSHKYDLKMKNLRLRAGFSFCWTEPISRVLSWTIIYLGYRLLSSSSGTPATTSQMLAGTALHGGKDLVVALLRHRRTIPRGNSSPFGYDVSVGTSAIAGDGRYPLPFCLPESRPVSGLSSPRRAWSDCLAWSASIIPHPFCCGELPCAPEIVTYTGSIIR